MRRRLIHARTHHGLLLEKCDRQTKLRALQAVHPGHHALRSDVHLPRVRLEKRGEALAPRHTRDREQAIEVGL